MPSRTVLTASAGDVSISLLSAEAIRTVRPVSSVATPGVSAETDRVPPPGTHTVEMCASLVGELGSAAAAAALALAFAGGEPAPASAIWLRLLSGSAGSQRSTASLGAQAQDLRDRLCRCEVWILEINRQVADSESGSAGSQRSTASLGCTGTGSQRSTVSL